MRITRVNVNTGQAATEYLLITAVLVLVLMTIEPDAIGRLFTAIGSRFASLSFSVSLP